MKYVFLFLSLNLLRPLLFSETFEYPQRNKVFEFPKDHGSHPDFRTEWWYITGHFKGENDQDFGFQLTFFRSASDDGQKRQSYMAHAAIVNKTTGQYFNTERFNKEGWNAGASEDTLNVFNGNWYLRMDGNELMDGRFSVPGAGIVDFTLQPMKPLVLFGDQGFSQKAEGEKNSSHYITYTRLNMAGNIQLAIGESVKIRGQAWMDHEFSSSHLSDHQIGWDWASIQLHDGTEIMVYSMRRKDGKVDPYSVLNEIDESSNVRSLYGNRFTWEKLEYWENQETGNRYPVAHKIEWIDSEGNERTIILKAIMKSQEFVGSISGFHYWEGACIVLDKNKNELGKAYVELTGYGGELTF